MPFPVLLLASDAGLYTLALAMGVVDWLTWPPARLGRGLVGPGLALGRGLAGPGLALGRRRRAPWTGR